MVDKAQILTTREAAEVLGVTRQRVHQLGAVLLPAHTATGRRIYLRSAVEAYAAERAARRAR